MVQSRERARALIMAGQVVVADHVAEKPGQIVPVEAEIRLKGEVLPFVSRGGLKLQKALDEFSIDVTGLIALDVGASTGGFTDCLLQRGAAKVLAVDVGYGQLAWKFPCGRPNLSVAAGNGGILYHGSMPKKLRDTIAAMTDEKTSGAKRFIEKFPSTISDANTAPAIGAL